jgi:hypothetical protein
MFDRILSILLMNLDLEWLVYIQCCSHIFVDLRYAYAVASALHGVRHILHEDFMLQVPVVYGNASCISLFLKVAHSELPISMYVSATMGFGSWEEIYYPLHLWMRLQYEGKRRDLSLSLSLIFIIIFSDFDVLTVILHLLFFFVFFLQMFTSCFLDNQYLILILLIMICYYPGRINIWKDWRMAV